VAVLSSKYNVEKVDLFGSYATGKATDESDVDLLVKFSKQPPSIFAVMGLKEELQRKLLVSVDVVTLPLSRPDKFSIERTLNVYEKR
jgi:predicted nucleotidyltransferase